MPCLHGFCFYPYNGIVFLKNIPRKIAVPCIVSETQKYFFAFLRRHNGICYFKYPNGKGQRLICFSQHAEINCACKVWMLTLWYRNLMFYAATNIPILLCQKIQFLKASMYVYILYT